MGPKGCVAYSNSPSLTHNLEIWVAGTSHPPWRNNPVRGRAILLPQGSAEVSVEGQQILGTLYLRRARLRAFFFTLFLLYLIFLDLFKTLFKYLPVYDFSFLTISSGVPLAIILPPRKPPSGPISRI